MATFENFTQQSGFLSSLSEESRLSLSSCYLMGVCHARTGLGISTLQPFLEEIERSYRTGWLTSEERVRVEYEVYLGAVGKARELLSAYQEGKGIGEDGEARRRCDVCGEDSTIESGCVVTEACGHFTHSKCVQSAAREGMLGGGHQPIKCPVLGCEVLLTESHLQRLFSPEDYQILYEYWGREVAPAVVVLCPNFHCKASSLWQVSQYFSCQHCRLTYCLHCLSRLEPGHLTHTCLPHSEEALTISAEFSQGNRFKVCTNCGYWCSLAGERNVTCCCGREMCGRCVLKSDRCTCDKSILDKVKEIFQGF